MQRKSIACLLAVLIVITILPAYSFAYEGENLNYTKIRLAGADRYETSFLIADDLYRTNGEFQNVIVAYGRNFPDALAGGYLAKEKNAPILLSEPMKELDVLIYILGHASPDAGVYILGGTGVISTSFEWQLVNAGFRVTRLGGATRFETNLAILDAVHVKGKELLVSDGYGFADSLSGSAVGKPILIVDKNKGLLPEQKAWLSEAGITRIYILGGPGSVSNTIEGELRVYAPVKRLGGANRHETSALIAREFFPYADTVTIACSGNFPDGLSGAPIALRARAPMLLVSNNSYMDARAYVQEQGADTCYVIGGTGSLSDEAAGYVMGEEVIDVDPGNDEALMKAYSAYYDILTNNRSRIEEYDWQKRGGSTGDNTTRPVVICDVYGDEIPELIYLAQGAEYYYASLNIVAYEENTLKTIYQTNIWDSQVGSGTNYYLFQLKGDKKLYSHKYFGNETWWYYYEAFETQNGQLQLSEKYEEIRKYLDYTGQRVDHEYLKDGWEVIPEAEYNRAIAEYQAKTETVLMHTNGSDFATNFVKKNGCPAMTCREAIEFLQDELREQ